MLGLKIFLLITAACFIASPLYADIYEWTDENGVRHFTNYAPPPEAAIMIKSEELPYDEEADHARLETEREAQLELDRLELAERKLELERHEAEVEQKLAEADRRAEELLREAEKLLDETRNESYDYGNSRYPIFYRSNYPYYYNNGHYYRNETGSIYFIKRPYKRSYKGQHYKNYRYGYHNSSSRNKFHDQKYGHKKAHLRNDHFRSTNGNHQNRFSNRAHGSTQNGRRYIGSVPSVSQSWRN